MKVFASADRISRPCHTSGALNRIISALASKAGPNKLSTNSTFSNGMFLSDEEDEEDEEEGEEVEEGGEVEEVEEVAVVEEVEEEEEDLPETLESTSVVPVVLVVVLGKTTARFGWFNTRL